jgi:cytochrome P450
VVATAEEGGSRDLLESYSATITFDTYETVREALFNPSLSRSFDKRSYGHGNIRDGVVSITHGPTHRARRRVENSQFRPDKLRLYERVLFPTVLGELLDVLIDGEFVDIFPIGELVSVVLAARRAGLDQDDRALDQLRTLVRFVDVFSQGSAILDARDPEAVRTLVYRTYEEFERGFVRPAWDRRAALIQAHRDGRLDASHLPNDILTVLLLHRDDPHIELDDDGRVVRETATYLQGGTHTSAQTLTNALDLMFEAGDRRPDVLGLVARDRGFAQRVVHETLRLRPTTPKIKRRAEADTEVAGVAIPRDALVVLDAVAGNRDPAVYGPTAHDFDPDRTLPASVPRWGLSFGAGAHQCPGRSVAGGFPVPSDLGTDDEHLFGLVALMIQAVAARGVLADPDHPPERDLRTARDTRWLHYPVRFGPRR